MLFANAHPSIGCSYHRGSINLINNPHVSGSLGNDLWLDLLINQSYVIIRSMAQLPPAITLTLNVRANITNDSTISHQPITKRNEITLLSLIIFSKAHSVIMHARATVVENDKYDRSAMGSFPPKGESMTFASVTHLYWKYFLLEVHDKFLGVVRFLWWNVSKLY